MIEMEPAVQDVERTSERERRSKDGSERWEGDRVDRDREGKLAIGSYRRGERGSERDRESREDQRGGRNTIPKEDRKEYDSNARDKTMSGRSGIEAGTGVVVIPANGLFEMKKFESI